MESKGIQGQEVIERMNRKRELKETIEDINRSLETIRVPAAVMSAGDAKKRLDSFVYLNGGDEIKIPQNKKGEFQKLKEDAEAKESAAKEAKREHKELSSKLTALKKELMQIQSLTEVGDFKIEGLRDFVLGVVEPWLVKIRSTEKELKGLTAKRDSLEGDLNNPEFTDKYLDEKVLMDISVEDHLSALKDAERLEERQLAAEDLMLRTESAIEVKKKQLQTEKEGFADDLTHAVGSYTHGGVLKMAQMLKQMLSEDDEYSSFVRELCHELLSETNTDPASVFGHTGGSLPVQIHILNDKIREVAKSITKEIAEHN